MNNVPGSEQLGWGFSIFGPYGDTALKSQLFEMQGGTQWEDNLTKISYLVPGNVASPSMVEDNSAHSYVFNNRTQLQEHFAAKASVDASYVSEYGAFSGAFDTAYTQETATATEYKYGVYEANSVEWELALESQSLADLTSGVRADFESLPTTYSDDNQQAFFAFFDKYGTHYVERVRVGGRLYYYIAVEKSYLHEDKEIKAKLDLEYNAVVASAKAKSSADWQQLTDKWTKNRTAYVHTIGGTPNALLLAEPQFGDSREGLFESWVDSIKTAPAVVDYTLRPITVLFPLAQQQTIQQAYDAYLSANILTVESRSVASWSDQPADTMPVVTLGVDIRPSNVPRHDYGFQLMILQPEGDGEYEIFLDKYYSCDLPAATDDPMTYKSMFDDIAADIRNGGYEDAGYVLVLASFNWSVNAPPTSDVYRILRSAGAGRVLEHWINNVQHPGSIGYNDFCTYILIGNTGSGPGTGTEAMEVEPIPYTGARLDTIARVRISDAGEIIRLNEPAAFETAARAESAADRP
jgi:hypothetical protein